MNYSSETGIIIIIIINNELIRQPYHTIGLVRA